MYLKIGKNIVYEHCIGRITDRRMRMKILVIDTDYPKFLYDLYKEHHGLKEADYDTQMKVRMESLFGNYYVNNLRKLGHEAWQIYSNNEYMQKEWAKEHCTHIIKDKTHCIFPQQMLRVKKLVNNITFGSNIPYLRIKKSDDAYPLWFYDILTAQVEYYQPDILLNQAMNGISCQFMQKIKSKVGFLVGQHAATRLDESENWGVYDLVVSSFPPTVEWFHKKGIHAELHRLGFEPQILSSLHEEGKIYDVSFIGSLIQGIHEDRLVLLEEICRKVNKITIWTPDINQFSKSSPIRKACVGEAWGRSMFQILHNSKITINHHGSIPPYANNMRLYEATGVGTLLITDWKDNLTEMFEPGKEVVTYHTPEECVELINYYLENDQERQMIAKAGQERTLRDHTSYQRMKELLEIIDKYI